MIQRGVLFSMKIFTGSSIGKFKAMETMNLVQPPTDKDHIQAESLSFAYVLSQHNLANVSFKKYYAPADFPQPACQ